MINPKLAPARARTYTEVLQQIDPRLSVRYDRAEDETVDNQFAILLDGKDSDWSIQLGYDENGGYAVLNKWEEDRTVMRHWDVASPCAAIRKFITLWKA